MTNLAEDYLDLDSLFTRRGARAARPGPRLRRRADQARTSPPGTTAGHFPREIVKEMGDLGLLGMHLKGYGCPGRSAVEYGLAAMELEAGDSGLRTFVSVQGSLAMSAIHKFGSEEQKQHWLPGHGQGRADRLLRADRADRGQRPGEHAHDLARRDGDEWVLDGAKRWIGLASIADVAVIWAQDRGREASAASSSRPPRRGFTATPIEPKLSMRASIQCDITLDDVRLPGDAVLPGVTGLKGPFSCLNEARYGIIWGAMGAARDSYEAALAVRARAPRSSTSRSRRFQLTQQKLVDMVLEIQKGVLVALQTGRLKDAGTLRPAADLVRQAQQRPRGHRDLPRGPHHPRRQRHHAGPLAAAAREQPRERADLRGHRRGAHPDHGPGHHRHPRVQLRDRTP